MADTKKSVKTAIFTDSNRLYYNDWTAIPYNPKASPQGSAAHSG